MPKTAEPQLDKKEARPVLECVKQACLYRRKGQPRTALKLLQKCLAQTGVDPLAGDIHLNMCAVLSQLGRHGDALKHARVARRLLCNRAPRV